MKYYEIEFIIKSPKANMNDARDLVAYCAGEAGFETFEETEEGLKGYVQTSLFDKEALDNALSDFPLCDVTIDYNIKEAEDRDWNETWENEGFAPIVISDRCVIHDGRHLPKQHAPIEVEIDAKQAFGTGTHETTRMITGILTSLPLAGKRMLDAGCGTGILSIVALKCGADMAIGYDIDEWSVDNARHNAIINQVDNRFTSLQGDASIIDDILQANTPAGFDILTANINRNILINDMPQFAKALRKNGLLILSGFYISDIPMLQQYANKQGFTLNNKFEDGEWACIVLNKS